MKMNLANKITISRIVMVFIFLLISNVDVMIEDKNAQFVWRFISIGIMIFAGASDFLDGYVARKYNMVTDFGKLMDPLADKIFMAAALVVLVDKQCLPGWVAVVILSREFMVTGLRLLAANKGQVISADITGKIKSLAQMLFVGIGGSIWASGIDPKIASKNPWWIVYYSVITAFTVYSGVVYFVKHRNLYKDDV
jgi:CDP-diacylglycerol---glycerol-3-phosphate 3-phosphatidyltransferase